MPWDLARYVNPEAAERAVPAGFFDLAEGSVSDLVVGGDLRGAVGALYEVLAGVGIAYTWEDINLSDPLHETQVIRSPADIVDSVVQNRGTCLDLCVLFASLCVSVRLLPFLVLVETPDRSHALVVVDTGRDVEDWLPDRLGWPAEAGDETVLDGEAAAGFLAWGLAPPGRLVAVETTGFARTRFLDDRGEHAILGFEEAAERARHTLEAAGKVVVVDVVKLSALPDRAPYTPPPGRRARLGELAWEPWPVSEVNPYRPPVNLRRPEVDDSRFDFETVLPPYIPRPRLDDQIDKALARVGGFVLLVGKPQTGKTRAGFEAIIRCCGEKRLLVPADPRRLGALLAEFLDLGLDPEGYVLWLDNLYDYLDLPDPLSPHQLHQLVAKGLTVVATIWAEEHYRLKEGASPAGIATQAGGIRAVAQQTLNLVSDTIEVSGGADPEELKAARSADAYSLLEFSLAVGIAETLTALPTVREHYRTLDDAARAVVDATISLARAGAGPAVPLEAVATVYADWLRRLDPGVGDTETRRSFQDAVDQATGRIGGTHQRLLTRPNGVVEPFPRLVHDAKQQSHPIPDSAWTTVLATADSWTVATHAYQEHRHDIAEQLFTELAQSDHSDEAPRAAVNLGGLFADAGRLEEAEAAYREAMASGHPDAAPMAAFNLGVLFGEAGRVEEAEAAYRVAMASNHPDLAPQGAYNLGVRFGEAGRVEEAEAAYREAMASGHPDLAPKAAVSLGVLFGEAGRVEDAETAYREAMASGHPDLAPLAAVNLGVLFGEAGRVEEAEAAYREAMASGHPDQAPMAAFNLGLLLEEAGRVEDAEAADRVAMASGHPDLAPKAAVNLGVLFGEAGRVEDAEAAYREAMASGHPDQAPMAAFNLGVLFGEAGRVEDAEAAYREAMASGHPDQAPMAAFNLGLLLEEAGRVEDAEAADRVAMASGHPDLAPLAAVNLGVLFGEAGRVEDAEAAYREAMASGHPDQAPLAAVNLGVLFGEAGRVEDAEAAYREAMASGHPDQAPMAAFNLGLLLEEAGRVEDAEAAYREAMASGHPDAAPKAAVNLGVLFGEAGRVEEAEAAYREAMASGHPDLAPLAAFNLGNLLRGGRSGGEG